jgi:uncharacterized protein (UPF0548 family)
MISIRSPNSDHTLGVVASLAGMPFSYPEVGATRGDIPSGYNIDQYSTVLGRGDAVFESAKAAIRGWVPFRLDWIRTFSQAEPARGVGIAVVARLVGLWWTNVSRVIYMIDEPDRFGFAYGTLGHHAEMGEERFLVVRDPDSGEVQYSILAFSRPRLMIARIGYPMSRAAQRKFGSGSLEAMRRATSESIDS